jgi:hypothetical protein
MIFGILAHVMGRGLLPFTPTQLLKRRGRKWEGLLVGSCTNSAGCPGRGMLKESDQYVRARTGQQRGGKQ